MGAINPRFCMLENVFVLDWMRGRAISQRDNQVFLIASSL